MSQLTQPQVIKAFRWIALAIGILGFVTICVFSHWAVALGVFLMIWANNLQTAASMLSKTEELVDTMRDAMDKRYVQK